MGGCSRSSGGIGHVLTHLLEVDGAGLPLENTPPSNALKNPPVPKSQHFTVGGRSYAEYEMRYCPSWLNAMAVTAA